MIRAPYIRLILALAAAALLAGCGSSSGSSSGASNSTGSNSSDSTSSSSTGTTASTGTTSSGTAPAPSSAAASCKSGVEHIPTLSAATKAKLEAICVKAGTNAASRRKAAKELCRELVNASPLPAGPEKEHALAGCESAGGK